jgi:hypothetical protein
MKFTARRFHVSTGRRLRFNEIREKNSQGPHAYMNMQAALSYTEPFPAISSQDDIARPTAQDKTRIYIQREVA